MQMFCPKLLLDLLLNPRRSNPSTILPQSKYLTPKVTYPHLRQNPEERKAALCDLMFWRTCMCIPVLRFLQFSHRSSFSTPSCPPGKFHARAPARFVLSFFSLFFVLSFMLRLVLLYLKENFLKNFLRPL